MKWLLEDLAEGKTFHSTLDYSELIDMRYELVRLSPIEVSGMIKYSDEASFINMQIEVDADIKAANSGETIRFTQTLDAGDLIDEIESISVDLIEGTIDITPYVKELVDVNLPDHVIDPNNSLEGQKGSSWKFISEEEYMENLATEKTESKFANLSQLLNEKNMKK